MSWYLVEASHGPGHQSHTSKIRWSEDELDEAGMSSLWDDTFEHGYDWPIGSCIKLEGLTENRQCQLQIRCRATIESAEKMLAVLEKTLVISHEVIPEKMLCYCGSRCYVCSRCGTVLCYAFTSQRPDAGWCPDCQSCQGGKHEWAKEPPIVCTKCGIEHPLEKQWKRHREREGRAS